MPTECMPSEILKSIPILYEASKYTSGHDKPSSIPSEYSYRKCFRLTLYFFSTDNLAIGIKHIVIVGIGNVFDDFVDTLMLVSLV